MSEQPAAPAVKSYDVKELLGKLKSQGLDVAEEAAKVLVSETLDWMAESAAASENKFDDLLVAIVPVVKPHIMDMVDKIDGEVG